MEIKLYNGKWLVNGKEFKDMDFYDRIILDLYIKKTFIWN